VDWFSSSFIWIQDPVKFESGSALLIKIRDAPDIRPDNPAFFDIRYPAGYRIAPPDIR
jgi:hypothetical protein